MKFTVGTPTRDPAKLAAQKAEAERTFARTREKEFKDFGAAEDGDERDQFVDKLRGD